MEIKPLLSILIATTSTRSVVIKPLLAELTRQILNRPSKVELIINDHETDCIGKKRNDLLQSANGEYVVMIDSDDEIDRCYILTILCAIECDAPDCIGINGTITTNGKDERKWYISKDYKFWFTGRNGVYYRTPNHISPVRRELALLAGFPEISHGEDHEFSKRLLPYLKTESIITRPLYKYKYVSNK